MRRSAILALAVLAGLLASSGSAAARWSNPLLITPRDVYTAYVADLAVGRTGDVAAIVESYSAPEGLLVYSSHDRGPFEWEKVNDSGGESPAIGFDRQGATLVLSHRVDDDNAIRLYSKPRGGSFGTARLLDLRPGYPAGIATSPTGDVFAYWTGTNAQGTASTSLRIAVRPAGSEDFGPVQDLSAPNLDARSRAPQIVFNRAGDALILWTVAGRLEYAIRHPGEAFGPTVVLSASVGDAYDLASTAVGRAVAVWRDRERREIRASFGSVAGGFGQSSRIGGRATRGPEVVVNRLGESVAAWRTGGYRTGASSERVRAAVAEPGAGFGAPRVVYTGFVDRLELAADGHGTATVAWLSGSRLLAARHTAGKRGSFALETVGQSNVRGYSIGATRDGRTVLAWKAFAKHGSKRVKAAIAHARRPFGPVRNLGRLGRVASFRQDPYVSVGGDGGAFVWWGVERETEPQKVWFAGRYLLP